MRTKNKQFARLSVMALSLALAACGGGGGGSSDDGNGSTGSNQAPSVSVAPISIPEGKSATLKVTASDSDGSIASFAWVQKSGVSLALSGTDTDTLSISAPAVSADSQATLAVTVTDDDGAKTTKDVTVTVVAHMVGVTVQGLVTDNPVANAEITFSVGEQSFTTTANANGQYSIALTVDDSRVTDMVRAEATSQDAKLKLVSLMGDVQALTQAAGTDGVLTRDEHMSVNISNLTTALAAQLEQGEPGSITSAEQLAARKKMISGSEAFHMATLIKLVLDYSDSPDVVMPGNIADTYALASDREAASLLAADIQKNNAAIYQTALDTIIADQSLVMPVLADSAAVQDEYYLTTSSLHPVSFADTNSVYLGHRLRLKAQGNGELSRNSGAVPFTWTASADGLEIQGAEVVVRSQFYYDDTYGRTVEQQEVVRPTLINWLDHGAEVDWLAITAEQFFRYPGGEYPSTEPVRVTDATMAIRDAGTASAAQLLQMGLAFSMPLPWLQTPVTEPSAENPGAYLDVGAVQLTFAGSVETGGSVTISQDSITGAGVASSSQVTSAWAIDDCGCLQIANILGYSAELVLLESDNQKSPRVFVELTNGVDKLSTIGNVYLKEAPAWTPDRAVGIYRHAQDFYFPLQPYWFEVYADGTALTVSGWDQNQDGELTQDEFSLMPGFWRINDAGNLLIRRYFDPSSGFCASATWDPAPSEDCVLYNEREWVLHQEMDGEGIGLRHYHRFFMDPFLDRSMPLPDEHVLNYGTNYTLKLERLQERPFPIPSL